MVIEITKKIMYFFVFYSFIILLASGFLGSLQIKNPVLNYSDNIQNIVNGFTKVFPSQSNPYPYIKPFSNIFNFLVIPLNWIVGFFVFIYSIISIVVYALLMIITILFVFIPSILNASNLGALAILFDIVNIAIIVIISIVFIEYIRKWIDSIHI